MWLALLESGVHATLAAVSLGLLTPAWPLRSLRRIAQRLAKIQLTLHVVPRRGVILGQADGPLRARG